VSGRRDIRHRDVPGGPGDRPARTVIGRPSGAVPGTSTRVQAAPVVARRS